MALTTVLPPEGQDAQRQPVSIHPCIFHQRPGTGTGLGRATSRGRSRREKRGRSRFSASHVRVLVDSHAIGGQPFSAAPEIGFRGAVERCSERRRDMYSATVCRWMKYIRASPCTRPSSSELLCIRTMLRLYRQGGHVEMLCPCVNMRRRKDCPRAVRRAYPSVESMQLER